MPDFIDPDDKKPVSLLSIVTIKCVIPRIKKLIKENVFDFMNIVQCKNLSLLIQEIRSLIPKESKSLKNFASFIQGHIKFRVELFMSDHDLSRYNLRDLSLNNQNYERMNIPYKESFDKKVHQVNSTPLVNDLKYAKMISNMMIFRDFFESDLLKMEFGCILKYMLAFSLHSIKFTELYKQGIVQDDIRRLRDICELMCEDWFGDSFDVPDFVSFVKAPLEIWVNTYLEDGHGILPRECIHDMIEVCGKLRVYNLSSRLNSTLL